MDSNLGAFGEQPLFTKTGSASSTKVTYADPVFTTNIMSLESGLFSGGTKNDGMFRKSNITKFDTQIPSLTDAYGMFSDCTGLTSWTVPLPDSLTNANHMFNRCTGLKSWTVPLPDSLTYASYMFASCTGLTSWTVPLPQSLTNAGAMFQGCKGFTSWTVPLPQSLTNASSMFSVCSGLKSWTVPLPDSLTYASYMFSTCTGLKSWTVPLPDSLTNASSMFASCTGLTSWTVPLPQSLTDANTMFGNTGLREWTVALPQSLTNAHSMFSDCTNLVSFSPWGKNEDGTINSGTTGNLNNGYKMFHKCKLDLSSVKRIADWLPTRTNDKPTGSESLWYAGWIHIGVAQGVNSGDDFNNAISTMTSKNWSVVICVNGSETTV